MANSRNLATKRWGPIEKKSSSEKLKNKQVWGRSMVVANLSPKMHDEYPSRISDKEETKSLILVVSLGSAEVVG